MNENTGKLVESCETSEKKSELVLGESIYPHKNTNKTTWESPNGRTKNNRIDHIMIHRKSKMEKYSTGCRSSDYLMLLANVKIKIAKNAKIEIKSIKYNVDNLQINISKTYSS